MDKTDDQRENKANEQPRQARRAKGESSGLCTLPQRAVPQPSRHSISQQERQPKIKHGIAKRARKPQGHPSAEPNIRVRGGASGGGGGQRRDSVELQFTLCKRTPRRANASWIFYPAPTSRPHASGACAGAALAAAAAAADNVHFYNTILRNRHVSRYITAAFWGLDCWDTLVPCICVPSAIACVMDSPCHLHHARARV